MALSIAGSSIAFAAALVTHTNNTSVQHTPSTKAAAKAPGMCGNGGCS